MAKNENNNLLSKLSPLVSEFKKSAALCFENLFNIDNVTLENWKSTEYLQSTFDYIFINKSENKDFNSILIVGIGISEGYSYIGEKFTLDETKDALTEFGNVYCGLINDIPQFNENFGILVQKPPQEAIDYAFFPKVNVIEGDIVINSNARIYLGYGIRPNKTSGLSDGLSKLLEGL